MSRKKILWLCSWYPAITDPFNGDFVQRHAQAASLFNDIHVIHVAAVTNNQPLPQRSLTRKGDLSEEIIYFRKSLTVPGRLFAHWRLLRLYKRTIDEYISREGKPGFIHVHIPAWAGVAAVRLKRKYGIPFVITEHWGIYNNVEENNFQSKSIRFRNWTRKIIHESSLLLSPSSFLASGINKLVVQKGFVIVPNTVDVTMFSFKERNITRPRFIHVSNMVPLKNVPGILRAFFQLLAIYPDAEMVMVGNKDVVMVHYASSIGLTSSSVRFTGEISYAAVADEMKKADCLVLFSNIENSPCVIGEALCCGLGVITTKVGGIPELVNESNSILLEPADENALTTAMKQVIEKTKKFDRHNISAAAVPKFSFESIGKKIDDVYNRVMSTL